MSNRRTGDLRAYLSEHPEMMGALFAVALLAQASTAVANGSTTYTGP